MDISDLHLCHLIVLLNAVCNCSNNLLSSSVDKVTTGTYNLVSVILNFSLVGFSIPSTGLLPSTASLFAWLVITQFSDQVKVKGT